MDPIGYAILTLNREGNWCFDWDAVIHPDSASAKVELDACEKTLGMRMCRVARLAWVQQSEC